MTCLVVEVTLPAMETLPLTATTVGAVLATLFEALPLPLNDNLTIPTGSALSMTLTKLLM